MPTEQTIDQLTAAGAALLSHEYEVYDPAGSPTKTKKVSGTQIVSMVGSNASGLVPTARKINTTAPMTGGGDLSADRTLAVPTFLGSGAGHASGLVPDPGGIAGATNFLREDATWQVPIDATKQSNMTVVTVSPHGIADAYSTIPNNGAMFGIDTPGTSTCGLQEAFDSFNNPTSRDDVMGGLVQLAPGVYNCTSPIVVISNQIMEMKVVGCGLLNTVILYNDDIDDPGNFISFYSGNCRLTPAPPDYLSNTDDVSIYLSDFTIASVYDSTSYLLLWGAASRGIIRNVGFTYWPSALDNGGWGLVTGTISPSACPLGLSGLVIATAEGDLLQVEDCMFWYLANGIGLLNDHTSLINCNFNFIGLNGSNWPNHPVSTGVTGTNWSLLSALNSLGGGVVHSGGLGNLSMWNPTFYKCNICFAEGDGSSGNAHAVVMGGRIESCSYRFASYTVNAICSNPCPVEWYECVGTSLVDAFINYNAGTDTTTLGSPGTPTNLHIAGYLTTANFTANGLTPTTRNINTTAPITGGGDLSADRTIAISDFVASGASHARGAVPDPGASAGTTKFLREDATWQAAVPALRKINTTAPMTGGGTLTADLTLAVPVFVASGASHASGLVPDPGVSSGTTHFLREDATWQAAVPAIRKINTTAPMTGGGTLTGDLTLAVPVFVASGATHATGLVPDPGASTGAVRILREDATWNKPTNLLYDAAGNAILQVTTEATGKMLASIGANNLLLGANGAISFIVYGGNIYDPNSELVFDANHYFYDSSSTQILSSQQPAITDTDGSQADNARAIGEILTAMRSHGLIAT